MSQVGSSELTADDKSTDVRESIVGLTRVLRVLERGDLVERVTAAGARLKRPATIVCVVGEFKQGKSSLVNGLLGREVCPVDDDLATSSITLVRYGEKLGAVVRRRENGESVGERVPIEELNQWVSEEGNPGNERQVERVEIAMPAAMLKQGLILADTPGMGGLGAGHAAATLAFLPFSDGLLLVSDASSELSAPEIDFLARAKELCPTVLFVQTKIDLYPAWEKIFEINRRHLENRGLDIPMTAVSSTLRIEALARKDRDLNERSRFPDLIRRIGSDVIEPARDQAEARSANDVRSVIALVRSGLTDERQLISDPAAIESAIAELNAAKERLGYLRGPGARWSVLVGDRVSDLSTGISHRFRGGIRQISQGMDARIEVLKKGIEWDKVGRELQTAVADQVAEAFADLENGRISIAGEVVDLLQEEHLDLASHGTAISSSIDVTDFWRGKGIDPETGAKVMFKTGLTGVRGAQSGVMMFGMMGRFLPGAAAAFVGANPMLLGAGAVFGGMQLFEDRKRKVSMRRQGARQQVRQFIDDVQFEVNNEITAFVRDIQRELRDEFTTLLSELQATYTSTAQRAQAAAKQTQEERQTRSKEIAAILGELDKLELAAGGGGS